MTVKLHFAKYLDAQNIKDASKRYGYKNDATVETFIVDYEMYYHIQNRLADCVLKGGMAVPFYITKDGVISRLSVDVDVTTMRSKDDAMSAMSYVKEDLKGWATIRQHSPPDPMRRLPMLTYYCKYKSGIDDASEIKIDLLYGIHNGKNTVLASPPMSVMGMTIDFPITMYSRESLRDKLTTLPFNTIGLDHRHRVDAPKQIYDIAHLLKSSKASELSVEDIVRVFIKTAKEQITYMPESDMSMEQILEDMIIFSNDMQSENRHSLREPYKGRFNTFKTSMLGNSRYTHTDHATDVMLVRFLAILVKKRCQKEVSTQNASETLRMLLADIDKIKSGSDAGSKNFILKDIAKRGGVRALRNDNASKNLTAEQHLIYSYTCTLLQ